MLDRLKLLKFIVSRDREQALNIKQINVHFDGEEDFYYEFMHSLSENLWSVSKTFTSLAIGMAVDEGRVDLDKNVIDYFPEFREVCTEKNANIRVKDLLQMNSGKDDFLFREEVANTYEDYARIFFREEILRAPASGFNYNNMNTYMLSRIIENVYGLTLNAFLKERLFDHLEYFNVQWQTCPNGHTLGATGLHLRTFELARLGILLLNEGKYDGKQLISKEYVRKMHTDLVPTDFGDEPESKEGYGYQVWKCTVEDAFRADGAYGQYVIVYPSRRAVITATARNQYKAHDIVRLANDIVLGNY